jgi:hypothetical protein
MIPRNINGRVSQDWVFSWFQLTNITLQEQNFYSFWRHFHVLIYKFMFGWFLIWQSLCNWRQMMNDSPDSSHWSELCDRFITRYVTPKLKKSSVTPTAANLVLLFQTLCNGNSIFRLLDLSASEHWSSLLDQWLSLIICRVTVKWGTAIECVF